MKATVRSDTKNNGGAAALISRPAVRSFAGLNRGLESALTGMPMRARDTRPPIRSRLRFKQRGKASCRRWLNYPKAIGCPMLSNGSCARDTVSASETPVGCCVVVA